MRSLLLMLICLVRVVRRVRLLRRTWSSRRRGVVINCRLRNWRRSPRRTFCLCLMLSVARLFAVGFKILMLEVLLVDSLERLSIRLNRLATISMVGIVFLIGSIVFTVIV